jgi:hypothetical protein
MKPEDILNVMAVESGLDPSAHNKDGNASGLVQIMPKFLPSLGFKGTHEEFRQTSASDQLDYVEKLIQNMIRVNGGPLTSAEQYYIGNFLPVALKLPGVRQGDPKTVIVAKNPTSPHLPGVSVEREKKFYESNVGLDADHSGEITYGDIQAVLKRARGKSAYREAIAQIDSSKGNSQESIFDKYLNNKQTKQVSPSVDTVLSRYLALVADNSSLNKMHKKYLPYNSSLIKINASNINEALEFARILSLALDEELSAKVSTHLGNGYVEVECDAVGPQEDVFNAIDQLANSLAEVFFDVTKKIGGISIKTQLITNKKSSYQTVNLKLAESEHRKFLLKFV